MVNVLPEQSIILDGQQSYIYAANPDTSQNITFSKLMVKTGASENGYTAVELIDPIPDSMALVIEGAYYIYAKSKAGELEHDH
jgi:cobalt-zinc-cadmium efflux system membrane fusion protein